MNHFCAHCGGELEQGVCRVCERVQGVVYEQPCTARAQNLGKPIALAGMVAFGYMLLGLFGFLIFG